MKLADEKRRGGPLLVFPHVEGAVGEGNLDPSLVERLLHAARELVVLPGFGPGTSRVQYHSVMNYDRWRYEEIVVLDGEHDATFDLDLR